MISKSQARSEMDSVHIYLHGGTNPGPAGKRTNLLVTINATPFGNPL